MSLEQFFLTVGQNNFGNKIPFLNISWGFLLNSILQLSTTGLCTMYILWFCSFFFPMSSKPHSAVFVRNFLLLCYFWMITWLLMTFVDLFLLFLFLSLDLIFFSYHFLLESSAIHRFRNQLYFPVPFGDYLLMFLLTTFFLHKSNQSSENK